MKDYEIIDQILDKLCEKSTDYSRADIRSRQEIQEMQKAMTHNGNEAERYKKLFTDSKKDYNEIYKKLINYHNDIASLLRHREGVEELEILWDTYEKSILQLEARGSK